MQIKSVRIVQELASDAVRWQEDKYAQQQQWYDTHWVGLLTFHYFFMDCFDIAMM